MQDFQTDPPRVPTLLSAEHSGDETVSFPESSPTKRVIMPNISETRKPSRHRVRRESGVHICCYVIFFAFSLIIGLEIYKKSFEADHLFL